jgi:sterol desaturase/sphingolipid hydroxylase (fatty acid hydroxylase superfamily)
MDASTAARFHFGELFASVPFRCLVVALLGLNVATILAFELIFELAALFHHSNWRLPRGFERTLSRFFVTPRLHGIHHGERLTQTNSNWGTIFSCWDALHRTFRMDVAQSALRLGAPGYNAPDSYTPAQLLKLPFTK